MGQHHICPYIGPDYADLRDRRHVTKEQVYNVWKHRCRAAVDAGVQRGRGGENYHYIRQLGLDNPFMDIDAWRFLLHEVIRDRRSRARKAKEREKAVLR